MYLSPKLPATAETAGMKVVDSRIPKPLVVDPKPGEVIAASMAPPPQPQQSKILGQVWGMVLALDGPRTVADTVASIVATKYPKSRVDLFDCRSEVVHGAWMKDFNVYISAHVSSGGNTMVVNAKGTNLWSTLTPENMSLAYERAFDDFAQKIAAAPADLSQVVQ
jgi:hypothetical protein